MKNWQIFPSTAQLRQLPLQLSMIIPPQWEDRNGHVNVQFYQALYELGSYQVLEDVDVGKHYLEAQGYGMFDLEHHLHYRAEILVGERVSTYNRVLERNDKRFHGMYFIVNDSRDALACTLEYITSGVDLGARRMTPFPPELAQGIDRQIEQSQLLDWPAPLCGALGV
jgi:acyl-CoA thioester hydrolase